MNIEEELGWYEVNPMYVDVPLSEINAELLDDQYHIAISRKRIWPDRDEGIAHFYVFDSFVDSFLKMFNITSTKDDNNNTWVDYLAFMKKQHPHKIVKLYLNNSYAHCVAILETNVRPISANIALELYEYLSSNNVNVSRLSNNEHVTEFVVLNDDLVKVFDTKYGIYRLGGIITISHLTNSGVKIHAVVEHVCSGRIATIKNKSLSIFIDVTDIETTVSDIISAVGAIVNRSPFKTLIVDRLKASRHTVASIDECLKISKRLSKDMSIPMRASKMDLHRLMDYYGIVCPNVPFLDSKKYEARRKIGNNIMLNAKSTRTKWLSTNPSHITRLQLFHLLIDTRAEDDMVESHREFTGRFLFSVGDLEDTNAERIQLPTISKLEERKKRQKKALSSIKMVHHHESEDTEMFYNDDIISDFDSETETEDVHTDDIASDFDG